MLPIHLILSGPQEAPYPNGGDEAYWMGQVAGALAAISMPGGFPWRGGCPRGRMASLWLFPPRRRPRSGRAGRRALLCCGAPGTPWAGGRRRP